MSTGPNEQELIRRVWDDHLPEVADSQLMMLAMARLMESVGVEDKTLIGELYHRATKNMEDPNNYV